ncbi:MAG TPA: hypothetical protein VMT37_12890 [Solirubrobacterales bacterium]|nr:hypothetical protein [Solirubrobacterales bacterium]
MSVKQKIARKAVKSTAKHSAHGTAAKMRRRPLRTTTLLAAGGALGALVGWIAARRHGNGAVIGEAG